MKIYGRKKCLNDNDLDDLATKMNIKSGSFIAEDKIKNSIQEKQSLLWKKLDVFQLLKWIPVHHQKIIRSYLDMMANQ